MEPEHDLNDVCLYPSSGRLTRVPALEVKLHLLHKITLGLVRTVLAFFIYLEEDRTGSGLDDSERALL